MASDFHVYKIGRLGHGGNAPSALSLQTHAYPFPALVGAWALASRDAVVGRWRTEPVSVYLTGPQGPGQNGAILEIRLTQAGTGGNLYALHAVVYGPNWVACETYDWVGAVTYNIQGLSATHSSAEQVLWSAQGLVNSPLTGAERRAVMKKLCERIGGAWLAESLRQQSAAEALTRQEYVTGNATGTFAQLRVPESAAADRRANRTAGTFMELVHNWASNTRPDPAERAFILANQEHWNHNLLARREFCRKEVHFKRRNIFMNADDDAAYEAQLATRGGHGGRPH